MSETTNGKSIGIIGAGPIGIETALYAKALGFDVSVFERAPDVAGNVRQWGHVKLFTPFSLNSSRLGVSVLQDDSSGRHSLDESAIHSGDEWIDHYLKPIAECPLLKDSFHFGCEVVRVGRSAQMKPENVGSSARAATPFTILLRNAQGESTQLVDYLIDASGTFGHPNFAGKDGCPAVGEMSHASQLEHGIPRFNAADLEGKRVLVIGSGYSAATNIVQLCEIIDSGVSCNVVWATRPGTESSDPLNLIPDDTLVERNSLAMRANEIADSHPAFEWRQCSLSSIKHSDNKWQVSLTDSRHQETFEMVLANVGFRGDFELLSELQLHRCYATDGPIGFAASLLQQRGADCMNQAPSKTDAARTSEPNFFILGAKLYGRDSRFLFSLGLQQIRDVFRIVMENEELDLYLHPNSAAIK